MRIPAGIAGFVERASGGRVTLAPHITLERPWIRSAVDEQLNKLVSGQNRFDLTMVNLDDPRVPREPVASPQAAAQGFIHPASSGKKATPAPELVTVDDWLHHTRQALAARGLVFASHGRLNVEVDPHGGHAWMEVRFRPSPVARGDRFGG